MFESHPFVVLIVAFLFLVMFCSYCDIDHDAGSFLIFVMITVWIIWWANIPDTPEEIKAKQEIAQKREEDAAQKATPRVLSQADSCTVYVFERQGREHFFTRCENTTSTETNWSEGCGKGCSRDVKDTITTPNKPKFDK